MVRITKEETDEGDYNNQRVIISPLPVFTPEETIGLPSVRPSVRQSVSLSVCLSVRQSVR